MCYKNKQPYIKSNIEKAFNILSCLEIELKHEDFLNKLRSEINNYKNR